jgi:glyoxylase-like metal-dependent hydrolase (beta-lactamase superfamily II)
MPTTAGSPPIVRTFSTGSVRIHPQHEHGSRLPVISWLLLSRSWGVPRPVSVFVIEHEQGLVLFDTGQDIASVTEPDYYPRSGLAAAIYGHTARFEIQPNETVTAQLGRLGYTPSDVRTVVLSHLHQDHIGGLRELIGARFVATNAEWAELTRHGSETYGYLRRHTDLPGAAWELIDFSPTTDADLTPFDAAHDLFSDGSVVLLPTPGHTPGSMSMFIRRAPRPLLLVGDLTYGVDLMHARRYPGIGNRRLLVETTDRVLEFERRNAGLVLLPAHDPTAAVRLEQASPR